MPRPDRVRPPSFTEVTWERLHSDPEFAKAFVEAYRKESIPLQMMLLRTLAGISQAQLANKLGVQQTHLSRLEKDGSDHVVSAYEKVGQLLHAKLVLIPDGTQIVLNRTSRGRS